MKHILTLLFLLCLSTPVFATAGWYEGCNDNIKFAEDNGTQAYYEKLVKAFNEKYCYVDEKGVSHQTASYKVWNREVLLPLYKYISDHPVKYAYPEDLLPSQSIYSQYPKEKMEKNKEDARRMRLEQELEKFTTPLKKLKLIPN